MKILSKSEAAKVELSSRGPGWSDLLRSLREGQSALLSAEDVAKWPSAHTSLRVIAHRLGLRIRINRTLDGGLLVSLVTPPKK